MKTVRAKITWLFEQKRIPPILEEKDRITCNSYAPLICIKGQYKENEWIENRNAIRWSSVIFNESIDGKESISTVTYLVEKAPFELLKVNAEFELFEGPNKVATGKIIEEIN